MCGLVLDRDVNAARNILKRGLEIGRGPPEYTPVGEGAATRFSGAGQVASMKQEANDLSHRQFTRNHVGSSEAAEGAEEDRGKPR